VYAHSQLVCAPLSRCEADLHGDVMEKMDATCGVDIILSLLHSPQTITSATACAYRAVHPCVQGPADESRVIIILGRGHTPTNTHTDPFSLFLSGARHA
jgi:hypothetical protein